MIVDSDEILDRYLRPEKLEKTSDTTSSNKQESSTETDSKAVENGNPKEEETLVPQFNVEIFLPGLNNYIIISLNKFEKVMSLTNRKFWFAGTGGICFSLKNNILFLARYIINYSGRKKVDHKNRNQFDNTDSNLRIASRSQNGANRIKNKNITTSKYKGVCWVKKRNKWQSQIKVKRITKFLGYFKTEEEAAKAYNEAALINFGEFSLLNKILC